jgi:ATP-binding cassette subfamily B protein
MTTAVPAPAGLWTQLTTLAAQMRRVLPIIARRHKVMLILAMAVMMLNSALVTAVPVLFGALVNGLTEALKEGGGAPPLLRVAEIYLGLIGGVYLLRELLVVGQKYLVENACTRIERDMTVVVSHLFKADLGAVGRERAGTLQDQVSRSVEGLVTFLTLAFTEFLPGLMAIATALAWVLFVDARVGLVLCGVVPLYGVLALRQLTVQRASRREIIDSKQGLDAAVLERLGGLEYIRAAHTYHREVDRVEAAAEEQRKRKIRYYLSMARFDCLKALNEGFFHLLVLVLAIVLVARHSAFLLSGKGIEPGDVVMFSMLFYRVVNPLRALSATLQAAQECSLRVEDLLQLLAEPMDPSFAPALTRNLSMMARVAQLYWTKDLPAQVSAREPSLARGAPAIAVSDLFVEYPVEGGRPRRVLHGVSLTVEHGQMIGVAGPAGSGKSTWLKVLLRLTHPAAGEVFVGGVPLDGLSRESIGRLFGYVSQTPYLFAGTIEENIVYGSEGATSEAVRQAAALASIHDEIMAMPNGYQTAVAERGQNLSGGQRQRIALARVFLENPPILILDEATSALDNINERAVQEAVARSRADRTTVVVAHRLSTLRDADRILVFDQGRIVESGGFEELERGNGLFSRLVRSTGDVRLAS